MTSRALDVKGHPAAVAQVMKVHDASHIGQVVVPCLEVRGPSSPRKQQSPLQHVASLQRQLSGVR